MAVRNGYFLIIGGPTTTTSTSTFNLATIVSTAIPGIGALAGTTSISIRVVVVMLATAASHTSTSWERTVQITYVPGSTTWVLEEQVDGNVNLAGRVGDATSSTVSFSASGTSFHTQVTPDTTNSTVWYARLECNFIEFT